MKYFIWTIEQHIFAFSSIKEGTTEKMLQGIMSLKPIYNKNFCFVEQKCIFEHYRKIQTIKIFESTLLLPLNFFLMGFSELPLMVLFWH